MPIDKSGNPFTGLFLSPRNAAMFFVHGPGRFMLPAVFYLHVHCFPPDLQAEIFRVLQWRCAASRDVRVAHDTLPVYADAFGGVNAAQMLDAPFPVHVMHYLATWTDVRSVSVCNRSCLVQFRSDSRRLGSTVALTLQTLNFQQSRQSRPGASSARLRSRSCSRCSGWQSMCSYLTHRNISSLIRAHSTTRGRPTR